MESITTFDTKEQLDNYDNFIDITAHVLEEDEVYLEDSKRVYKFLLHAWIPLNENTRNLKIIGDDGYNNTGLSKVAKVRVIKLDSDELIYEGIAKRFIDLEEGNYRIDYAIYRELDGTYRASNHIFNSTKFKFVLVESDVSYIEGSFIARADYITGALFTNQENCLPLIQDVDNQFLENSENSVVNLNQLIIEDNILNTSIGGFGYCKNMGDTYINTPSATSISRIFRGSTVSDSSGVTSVLHLGENIKSISLRDQNKILRVDISPNNPVLEWDSTVNCVVKKTPYTFNNKEYIAIVTGGGIFPGGDYLYIPSNYAITSSDAFTGRSDIKVVNLYDYEAQQNTPVGVGSLFQGFFDCNNIKTIILPKNTVYFAYYDSLWGSFAENIIIPATCAPIVSWHSDGGDWYGKLGEEYIYSFANQGDWRVPNSSIYNINKHLYVLRGTNEEQVTWTNRFDATTPEQTGKGKRLADGTVSPGYWYNTNTERNERPNIWYDLIVADRNNPDQNTRKTRQFVYWEMPISYITQQEMDTLVENIVSEITNNNQS